MAYLRRKCTVRNGSRTIYRLALQRLLRFPLCRPSFVDKLYPSHEWPLPAHVPRWPFRRELNPQTRDFLEYLLRRGVSLSDNGYALAKSLQLRNMEMVEFLLKAGADPRQNSNYAFRVAVKQGDLPLVKRLGELDADADTDHLLNLAAELKHWKIYDYLIEMSELLTYQSKVIGVMCFDFKTDQTEAKPSVTTTQMLLSR